MANKKNSEIIFSIYLKKDEYNNMYMSTLSMSAAAGLLTNDIVNKEDIPYTNSTIARHVYAPSPRLISLFSDKDNRASSAYINAINSKGAVVFTSQNKFRGTAYTDDRYYDNDIVVYRLGEVKLLKAELLCYLGGDNVQKPLMLCSLPVIVPESERIPGVRSRKWSRKRYWTNAAGNCVSS